MCTDLHIANPDDMHYCRYCGLNRDHTSTDCPMGDPEDDNNFS